MRFVMSFSGGKDSVLALHTLLAQGHEAVALVTVVNEADGHSFFHGTDEKLLRGCAEALGLPIFIMPCAGESYHLAMEEGLRRAARLGAGAACFGDIDLENNRAWSTQRSENAGLEAVFPLWHHDRRENVHELLRLGYRCLIKTVRNTLLPESLLGTFLDEAAVATMECHGVDACGENGEYHTIVVDGPIFHRPVPIQTGKLLRFGEFSVIETNLQENEK